MQEKRGEKFLLTLLLFLKAPLFESYTEKFIENEQKLKKQTRPPLKIINFSGKSLEKTLNVP